MFRKAAGLSSGTQSQLLYVAAADLWVTASESLEAGKDFEKGGSFDKSALAYLAATSYDDAVRVVKEDIVPKSTSEKVLNRSRLAYVRSNQLDKAGPLFEDDDSLVECGSQLPL